MTLRDFVKSGGHLPREIRDFHAQKRVFKMLDRYVHRVNGDGTKDGQNRALAGIGWTTAHVYTIDVFLYVMAQFGYTLQRSRKKVTFLDLEAAIREMEEEEVAALKSFFDSRNA